MNNASAIIDIMNGFRRSKILFAGVKLGVFDALAQYPKGLRVNELASALPGRKFQTTDGLSRLLRSCVSLNLLSVDKQQRFSITPDSASTWYRRANKVWLVISIIRTTWYTRCGKTSNPLS